MKIDNKLITFQETMPMKTERTQGSKWTNCLCHSVIRRSLLSMIFLSLLCGAPVAAAGNVDPGSEVIDMRCEFMHSPLGIDETQPALSWNTRDARRSVVQTAYHILVASSQELLAQNQGDMWDSGRVVSSQSNLVPYRGKPLVSRERYFWKVQVETCADGDTTPSACWSPVNWWEMGLLKPDDWKGSWIQSISCTPVDNEVTRLWTRQATIPQEVNHRMIQNNPEREDASRKESTRMMDSILPVPVFRRSFEVPGEVRRARLYMSGLGFADAFINGQAASDRLFDPAVSHYAARGLYVTHDITPLVRRGSNVITTIVGGGLWHDSIVWGSPDSVMGQPSVRAQVEVELTDGRQIIVPTDSTWSTAVGPIVKSHYWAGEAYDARRAPNWKTGGDDGLPWVAATEVKDPVPVLEAQRCDPERIIGQVKPVAVTEPWPGIWLFDMGRMVTGSLELRIKAPAGTRVVMRTSEWTWNPAQQGPDFAGMLSYLYYDGDRQPEWTEGMIVGKPRGSSYYSWSYDLPGVGRLRQLHLGVPTLVYVARGDPMGETWRPHFSILPFRYVEVQGLKEPPVPDMLAGLDISNDEEVIGSFTSDNQRFNDIFEACMNSTRFNTHGMAWDNAVERLQSQVYNAWSAPFASYILWYPNLWRKVLTDQRLGNVLIPPDRQLFGGTVYGMRGNAFSPPVNPITLGVTVELPIAYYDRYGDERELESHYPHMKAWCEAFFPHRDGRISPEATMHAWKDHFYVEMSADSEWTPEWEPAAMMSMILHQRVLETADVARILGRTEDVDSLTALADRIRAVVNENWYDPVRKTYGGAVARGKKQLDTTTGWHGLMVMAIATGVAIEKDIPRLLDNCISDMQRHYRNHAATGHITHQVLYDVFSDHGLIDTCYDLMNATGFPSFAWMLQSGNRTIPEGPTWINKLPAAASACQNECQEPARWFTQTLCGVYPDRAQPGFKHVLLRPRFPTQLPSASLITTTPYGEVESTWRKQDGSVRWIVRIPANSHATAWIPVTDAAAVRESGGQLANARGCEILSQGTGGTICRLGSGSYVFEFPSPVNEPSRLEVP